MKIFRVLGMCVALLVVAPACDKDAKKNDKPGAASAAENKKKAGKLTAPAFFKKIPDDAVFVFANYERLDTKFINSMADYMAPLLELSKSQISRENSDAAQFMQEYGDIFTLAGLKKIGINTTPFFAFYSHDLSIVMRLELDDGTALLAFVDKLIAKHGKGDATLASKTAGSMRYWESPPDDVAMIVGVDKKELVVAFMPSTLKEDLKPYILGEKLPPKSIVDSGSLLKIIAENGGAKGAGYIDSAAAMKLLTSGHKGLAGTDADLSSLSKVCKAEFSDMAKIVPKIIFGYESLDVSEMSMYYGVQLRDDIAKRLAEVVQPVPGYGYTENTKAAVVAGIGVDVGAAMTWLVDISEKLQSSPYQCEGLADLNKGLGQIVDGAAIAKPMVGDIGGVLVILESFSIKNPATTTGMFAIQSKELGALLAVARTMVPGMSKLKVEPDAEPAKVEMPPMPIPVDVYAARNKTMLAFGLGDSKKNLKALINSKPKSDGPFFVMNYDYQVLAAVMEDEGEGGPESDMAKQILEKLGNMIFEVRATGTGLVMRSAVTWK